MALFINIVHLPLLLQVRLVRAKDDGLRVPLGGRGRPPRPVASYSTSSSSTSSSSPSPPPVPVAAFGPQPPPLQARHAAAQLLDGRAQRPLDSHHGVHGDDDDGEDGGDAPRRRRGEGGGYRAGMTESH